MACGGNGGGSVVPVLDSFLGDGDGGEDEDWGRIYSKVNEDLKITPEPIQAKGNKYTFNGVDVHFPYEAYKSQKQLMSKCIEGAKKGHNCLLESPTGTGKTAALLCALLGWQRYCRENFFTHTHAEFAKDAVLKAGQCTCGFIPDSEKLIGKPIIEPKTLRLVVKFRADDDDPKEVEEAEGDHLSSQASPQKIAKRETKSPIVRKKEKDDLCRYCVMKYYAATKTTTIPKIFYTTRTHSQVQQVVDQLKATPYRNVKMTILASRKMACINDDVIARAKQHEMKFQKNNNRHQMSSPSPKTRDGGVCVSVPPTTVLPDQEQDKNDTDTLTSVDDICRNLRKNYYLNYKKVEAVDRDKDDKDFKLEPACEFYNPKRKDEVNELSVAFRSLRDNGAWDIEELKGAGRECSDCPYYASQSLGEEAEIVFCPYNYIISSNIRTAVKIDLTGNIVVFDEAHNLEDICRDEASMSLIDLNRLDGRIRSDLDSALDKVRGGTLTPKIAAAEHFSMLLRKLSSWMRDIAPQYTENIYALSSSQNNSPKHLAFKDKKMLDVFEEIGFGERDMDTIMMHLESLEDAGEDDGTSSPSKPQLVMMSQVQQVNVQAVKFVVPSDVVKFVNRLLQTLNYLHQDDNYKHYNVILVNNGEPLKLGAKEQKNSTSTTSEAIKPTNRRQYNISLEILCLSPALVFKAIRDRAHTIIVTSGTLSPLESFAGELNTPFQVRLIAQHVVESFQTFSCSITSGVNKILELTRDGQRDVGIQDEVGLVISQVCQTVPHGVLVFLPSYTFMDTLRERWHRIQAPGTNTSILQQLELLKHVFFEERKDKEVFERDMQKFKELIRRPFQNSSQNGCLLFAIFRGKVSEGINFTDDQARAVVTVGIPFSNFMAYPIKYKRDYNDTRIRNFKALSALTPSQDVPAELLSGSEWYNIQAFRAMNQAFGRCVRHKNDWGAIIMLESRMRQTYHRDKLSSWVKGDMTVFKDFNAMKSQLVNFIQNRMTSVIPNGSSANNNFEENDSLDTSMVSVDMDMSNDAETFEESHTQLTQVTNNLKLNKAKPQYNRLPVTNCKPSCCRQSTADLDLDSSAYSLDESDCFDGENDVHAQMTQSVSPRPPISSIHDLPTQVIPQNISDDDPDISYHSSANSSSSNDIIEGTP